MTPEQIQSLFTAPDGSYAFARWGRPVAPIVFGVEEPSLSVIRSAIEALVVLANHRMSETDPELGANLMFFFLRDWSELGAVPDLDRLIPELGPLIDRLQAQDASQYRAFRFEAGGAIKAGFAFLRMSGAQADMRADTLALGQAARMMLLWSQDAFARSSPLATLEEDATPVLRPDVAALIRAAYDPLLPAASTDAAHAYRLFARMQAR